jgi:ligand-binding sensor domain-containing protein
MKKSHTLIGLLFILTLNLSCLEKEAAENVIDQSGFLSISKADTLKYGSGIDAIFQDMKGDYWFGIHNGGVCKYDGKNFKHYLPSLDYYKTNQDKRRTGNTQNSSYIFPENNPFIQSQDYISDDMIFAMMEDKAGNIWFATRNHGACRYDGKIFTRFGTKEGFISGNAYAILEDQKGNLWFTTEEDGVWCYDGKTIKNFNEKDGLINNAVMTVLEDKEGNLWFGTKWFGLSRYDGKTFTTFSQQ